MRHLAFLAFLVAGCSLAWAGQVSSVYSDLDLNKCKAIKLYSGEEGEGGFWQCRGIKGYDAFYWEGDLRGNMAFGPQARSQCASSQSFGRFNSPGAKIEWRMENGKPFATILRWFTDNGESETNSKLDWLVVTKLNGRDSCRTALIDSGLPDANTIARQKADGMSRSFNCEKDIPEITSRLDLKADEIMSGIPCPGGPYREE